MAYLCEKMAENFKKIIRSETFRKKLYGWNLKENDRKMPWKGEKDPYKIWISEIILQQTRVEQGLKYYNKFISEFPDVHKLASAPEKKVFKLWEGLGYYSRCRNMLTAAKFISNNLNGRFPDSYEKILSLKGVGTYTASAIASFAFNLPYPVLDGNVFRILARIFGISLNPRNTSGKKVFQALANYLLDKKNPGLYNQAMMDFGALVCRPKSPLCHQCVFNKICYAYLHNLTEQLPIRNIKKPGRKRLFIFLVAEYKNELAIERRTNKDIWQNLYCFPYVEWHTDINDEKEVVSLLQKKLKVKFRKTYSLTPTYIQQLSHQTIHARFFRADVKEKINNYIWITKSKLKDYPFPGVINRFLDDPHFFKKV
ncbi:MAG: A/G-specific adenine glycosylase [Chitinophagaceae bacterium]|nr:A/G-specific adenine glycosylase [Chitinophagaceae bacterium]